MSEHNEINQLLDSLLEVIQISDEDFSKIYEELVKSTEKALNGAAKEEIISNLLKEFTKNDSTKMQVFESGVKTLESYYNIFSALKTVGKSEEKHEFLDMIYGYIETIFQEAYERYDPNFPTLMVQLLNENAHLPTYAHEDDQGMDVYACEDVVIEPHTYGNMIHTGISLAIPSGWAVGVRARSGMSKKTTLRLSNCYGTIDTSYKDEVCVLFDNIGNEPVTIHAGDRIAQLVMERNYRAAITQVEDVKAYGNDRLGGFGSSGN